MFPKTLTDSKYKAFVDGEIKEISLQDYIGKYVVLAFYPLDFTFVCPTEINRFSDLKGAFLRRNAVVLLISCDSVYTHKAWASIPREQNGVLGTAWPMVWDAKRELCNQFGLYDEENGHPMRSTVILAKDLSVRHISSNYHAIGRSVDEIIRLIDAITFNDENGDICPAEWRSENKDN
ncbi:THIOREDOXIN PEROXIDASE (THIOL-SPECIFIC ANTIOXIDANT PROTEIN) [Encephalitozoon cuniculi GB-M1]|uniref:Putative thioredoxin peroxidase n=2 Tax=Encephalitozoon cuniculi TaxID=6035 RepID=TDX_ENCCU|nr:peroxiredoxin [Encephalitozoon cuniculi GB-M1]Q8SS85.1 RecName: Full=Putative thioredoxin peroxidase; AltName: Full=Peroxiredoxin; AltName: Full=Thioredoxin-dependent peroxide reductase; AltName: Full=Thioredoxin-dependent peroxiredoxin [Encephalitozoon cuniculi GB-M1]AGE95974.1 thiol-specific antioxidant protein [Encephalitozoon cuniculi]KMV66482.1 peroxiredoxin [Encephalitozoon cuniculi EcunIII-L]UYI28110.1 peroxidase [Encephalitozoon cuniculi]CAD26263.1 THIOREDOXIN PEROXIDASE (THIOL-SPEC